MSEFGRKLIFRYKKITALAKATQLFDIHLYTNIQI